MTEVLLVTGVCGVGKSTIARAWADARVGRSDGGSGAAVHADDIHLWMREKAVRRGQRYQEAMKVAVCVCAAREMVAQKISVAIDNVWTPGAMERLRVELAPVARVTGLGLVCHLAVNQARDQGRPVGKMGARVAELAAEMEQMVFPPWVVTLDTSSMSVAETVSAINSIANVDEL